MNRNVGATAFAILVWAVLLIFVGFDVYKTVISSLPSAPIDSFIEKDFFNGDS